MKEYLLLFRNGDLHSELAQSPGAYQAHMEKWMQWMGGLAAEGKLGSAQPLSESGRLVSGKKKVVTDGPFIEGKEMVGGYLICKADTYEAAVDIAKGCPILEHEEGIVEVREIRELKM